MDLVIIFPTKLLIETKIRLNLDSITLFLSTVIVKVDELAVKLAPGI